VRIAVLSSFYPLRGGISQFNAALLAELGKCHKVKAWNYRRQYPSFLFPGKTQYVTPEDEAVPVEQSVSLYEALKKAGVDVQLHIAEGKPHHGDPWYHETWVSDMCLDFLDEVFARK